MTSLDGPPGSELGLDPSTSGASLHSVGQGPTPASAYSRFFTLNPEVRTAWCRIGQAFRRAGYIAR